MIVLFTDYGLAGPYLGQVRGILARQAPGIPVIDLIADAPAGNVRAAAYLLAAYAPWFGSESVVLAVVDPGVGTERQAIAVEIDGQRYVGPDNGLFAPLVRRCLASGGVPRWMPIEPPGESVSATFHGRDVFAPWAARLARGLSSGGWRSDAPCLDRPEWPDDLAEVIYIDQFGNAMTGLRASKAPAETNVVVGGKILPRRRTFADVAPGEALCYENANGLLEIAVNRGRADDHLCLAIGTPVALSPV